MVAITYPATLPDPHSLTLRDAERRALQGMDGNTPGSTRTLERDYRGTATVSHLFTPEQFAAWNVWRELALNQGGAWFAASRWPCPWGRGCTARYVGPVSVEHVGRGIRRVESALEIRGTTEAPARPDPDTPASIVEIVEADLVDIGADLVAMPAMLASVDDVWHRINTTTQALELLGAPVDLGVLINPTRGSLPCGAVQFRGATDAANTLGRLGIVINGDNNTAAAARLSAGTPDRTSLITGSVRGGLVHVLPWPDPIELVHIARVSQTTTYSVVDTGPLTHGASLVEMLRLTFNESDDIRALLVEEYPTTDYAGASGTGSARLVRVRGVQGDTL